MYQGLPSLEAEASPTPPRLRQLIGGPFQELGAPHLLTAGHQPWQASLTSDVVSVTGVRSLSDDQGMFQVKWRLDCDDDAALWAAYERDRQAVAAFLALEIAGQSDGTLELRDLVVNRGSLELVAIIAMAKAVAAGVVAFLSIYPKAKEFSKDVRAAMHKSLGFLRKPAEQAIRTVRSMASEIAQRLRAFFGGLKIAPAG